VGGDQAMESNQWRWMGLLGSIGGLALAIDPVIAQVIPDGTLGAESSVIQKLNELSDRIDGGATRGANLFHSFQEFNVGEGRGVYFANPAQIQNILSRVTGRNASLIFGKLGVLGKANLFLINPNGILFGPNSSLDIQGSFFATTADGIRLGENGFFGATEPGNSNLLSVSPGASFFAQVANQTGSIINRGNLAVGGDLTLSAGNLDLQGQLQAGGNLTLQAIDAVQIRDSLENPFIVAAGGNLLVQGNQTIDIFVLNHPASGLFSGGDLILRSANTVGGDAHFWSGRNFRIEQLDGSLGDLYSPNDPVIRSFGDVFIGAYQGSSLHIIAGGKVEIPNGIFITGADPVNGLAETITLSNGTAVAINSRTEPTLDIRAGVDPRVVGNFFFNQTNYFPDNFTNFIFNPNAGNPPSVSITPTSADIKIGTIAFIRDASGTPLAGNILLTNQYQPNPALNGGIQISATAGGVFAGIVSRTGDFNSGGLVTFDSRSGIAINGLIHSSAAPVDFLPSGIPIYQGNGGSVTLLAKSDINFSPLSGILSIGAVGGQVTLNSQANISATNGSILSLSYTPLTGSKGGDINIIARELFLSGTRLSTSTFGGANAGNFKITVEKLDIPNIAQISTNTFGQGNSGNIIVNASESIKLIGTAANGNFKSGLTTETSGLGKAGDIDITTKNLSVQNGATISTATFGQGNAGDLTVSAESIELIGTSVDLRSPTVLRASTAGTGNAGNLTITTGKLSIQNGAAVSTATLGSGRGGNLSVTASDSIEVSGAVPTNSILRSGLVSGTGSGGQGGDLTIKTGQLTIRGGGIVSSGVGEGQQGKAGNLTVTANSVEVMGTTADGFQGSRIATQTEGKGNAGILNINTGTLILRDGGQVASPSLGEGSANTLTINASEFIEVNGISANGRRIKSGILSETSGIGNASDINIFTRKLSIQNGGIVSSRTFSGSRDAGNIIVNASELVELSGRSADGISPSGITTLTTGAGNAGNLTVNTSKLKVQDGAQLTTSTVGTGSGGNLTVNASDSVELVGRSPNGLYSSGLFSTAVNAGEAGDLTVTTGTLLVRDGAEIAASTTGQGNAGNILIKAADSIFLNSAGVVRTDTFGQGNAGRITIDSPNAAIALDGFKTFNILSPSGAVVSTITTPSSILSSVQSVDGLTSDRQAGDISIQGRSISLTNGSLINTTTSGRGNAGSVNINVRDAVILDGIGRFNSNIQSSVLPEGIGNGGDINITAGSLSLTQGARLRTDTSGQGNAGNINLDIRNAIALDGLRNDGFVSLIFSGVGSGAIGNGGDINIIHADSLSLTNGANISTSVVRASDNLSAGQGKAGNIRINVDGAVTINGEGNTIYLAGQPIIVVSSIASSLGTSAKGRAGDIEIQAGSLFLTNGGQISSDTFGEGNAGNITLDILGDITLAGTASSGNMSSGTFSTVGSQGIGKGGDITVQAGSLSITNNAALNASTAGRGNGGNIDIDIDNTLKIDGTNDNFFSTSGIFSTVQAGGIGNGGNVDISTGTLSLINGGEILTIVRQASRNPDGTIISPAGRGNGGNITVSANNITLEGFRILNGQPIASEIASGIDFGVRGNAGTVEISTGSLFLINGGLIRTIVLPLGQGNGGDMTIKADDILLDGSSGNFATGMLSLIAPFATGTAGNIDIQVTNSLTLINGASIDSSLGFNSVGFGGDITITGRLLSLNNNAQINASTFGRGNAGNITLQTTGNSLTLNNQSQISSRSQGQGNAGNITINSAGNVTLIDSDITTAAEQASGGAITINGAHIRLYGDSDIRTNVNSGVGGGGNITLTADSILIYDDSDILAFARDGQGGNITFRTGIFFGEGFQSTSDKTSPDNLDNNDRVDINASGAISGTISLPDLNFIRNSLAELPENLIDIDRLIANSCVVPNRRQTGTFVITGSGGLPTRPGDASMSAYPTGTVRTVPDKPSSRSWQPGDPIIEPQGVYRLPDGRLVFSRECR
jgi:filamentous hemagglutinin family protein